MGNDDTYILYNVINKEILMANDTYMHTHVHTYMCMRMYNCTKIQKGAIYTHTCVRTLSPDFGSYSTGVCVPAAAQSIRVSGT